jgi:antitoxin (DNA-binding transcriptional repressor) of toxin-antitoxin stability system
MDHIGDSMTAPARAEETIGVTAFKSQCLALIDSVARGKTGRVVLLKHRRPIAAIVPIGENAKDSVELWGAMRDTVTVAPGVDLTEPTGELWEAEL